MNHTTNTVVDFKNVHHEFGAVTVVEGLDLQVQRGERLAILGKTGAGKSTVLNLLIGNLDPTSGTVRVEGYNPYAEPQKLQGLIGMAFQTPRLLPWRTAVQNVAVGQEVLGVKKPERMANARTWLDRMHLTDSYEKHPYELSGGMRQRVSLARAFAIDPALVLLDESFSALDEVTARSLREEFVQLADANANTALIVTHNIEEAFAIAHRVIVLGRPARVLAEFSTKDEPEIGTTEFTDLRTEIRLMMAPTTAEQVA